LIWSGAEVSSAATRPPKPRHLGTPEIFLDVESTAGAPLLGVKRDGAAMFDQLRIPPALRPFLAQPPIRIDELERVGGLTATEIRAAGIDSNEWGANSVLYPLSETWRMGFAYSSAVCQDVSLAVC